MLSYDGASSSAIFQTTEESKPVMRLYVRAIPAIFAFLLFFGFIGLVCAQPPAAKDAPKAPAAKDAGKENSAKKAAKDAAAKDAAKNDAAKAPDAKAKAAA